MDKLSLFHINLRKSPHPSYLLCKSLSSYENVILSANEIPLIKKSGRIKELDIFDDFCYAVSENIRTRAAICVKGNRLKASLLTQLSNPDMATAEINFNGNRFVMISVYLPPDGDYESRLKELSDAVRTLRYSNLPILICSDTNSRSSMWNDFETNNLGRLFEIFLLENELVVLNSNDVNTFENSRGKSTIDFIFCNEKMME